MSAQTPAGWFPDPEHQGQERYWDGNAWTEQRRPAATPPQAMPGQPAAPTSSRATTSLILGILSLVCCGLVTGIPAMVVGRQATREINASNGKLGGAGLATAGFVTGLIGTILTTIVVVLVLGLAVVGQNVQTQFEETCRSITGPDASSSC